MKSIDRRGFLFTLGGTLAAASALKSVSGAILPNLTNSSFANSDKTDNKACWLDVSIPFVIEDPSKNYHTEIFLTSDCFPGLDGYETGGQENKYEVLLYDVNGKLITSPKDKANIVTVPAMRPTMRV